MSETVTITGITGHDAGMTGHIDRNRCRIPESGCGDDARRPGQLPWQSQYQGLQLLLADLQMGLIAGRPSEQALVETTGCQPDAHAIMHQNLEPVGATVGKDVVGPEQPVSPPDTQCLTPGTTLQKLQDLRS